MTVGGRGIEVNYTVSGGGVRLGVRNICLLVEWEFSRSVHGIQYAWNVFGLSV